MKMMDPSDWCAHGRAALATFLWGCGCCGYEWMDGWMDGWMDTRDGLDKRPTNKTKKN